jgi:hypothetical protein
MQARTVGCGSQGCAVLLGDVKGEVAVVRHGHVGQAILYRGHLHTVLTHALLIAGRAHLLTCAVIFFTHLTLQLRVTNSMQSSMSCPNIDIMCEQEAAARA